MDSLIEWQRAAYLYSLQEDGVISHLVLDKSLLTTTLVKGVKLAKHPLRPRAAKLADISYTPDFSYCYDGATVVEDVKGTYGNSAKNRAKKLAGRAIVTPASRLRIRLYQIQYPDVIFRICTVATASVDSCDSYEYF
jgi:hypothetical protein